MVFKILIRSNLGNYGNGEENIYLKMYRKETGLRIVNFEERETIYF